MKFLFVLASACLLGAPAAQAATQYTYDALNRLTQVVYDDGRSIAYSYDPAGNLLRVARAAPAADPNLQLSDTFDGTALRSDLWTASGGNTCGGIQVSGGQATFYGGTGAHTQGKKAFTGPKIVVEAVMAGTRGNRDTHLELIDTASGDSVQFGDTNYSGDGLYIAGTGRFSLPQRGLGQASTSSFKAYRLSIDGARVTVERGDSFDGPMQSSTQTLPNSIEGRSFFLRIGTGAPDCYYSPGTFDSVKVYARSPLANDFSDDFAAPTLDASKWISAAYNFEPDTTYRPVGVFSLHDGLLDLGYAGGVATLGQQHFKGRKIVMEARVARTGGGEFPIMLVSLAQLQDRIFIAETPYCGAGFIGAAGGQFKFTQQYPGCNGYDYSLTLGSPAPAGTWMEYRMTVDGNRFTMERGPTLSNITQSASATLGRSVADTEFFLYMRTGSAGGYFGAQFDWVRVHVDP